MKRFLFRPKHLLIMICWLALAKSRTIEKFSRDIAAAIKKTLANDR